MRAALAAFLSIIWLAWPAWASGAPAKPAEHGAPAKAEGGKKDGNDRFVKMEPISAPLPSGPKSERRQMFVVINLEVKDAEARAKVDQGMPRLRDAFLREFFGRPIGGPNGWEATDMDLAKQRLQAQSDRVLGSGAVADVLIVQAMRIGG